MNLRLPLRTAPASDLASRRRGEQILRRYLERIRDPHQGVERDVPPALEPRNILRRGLQQPRESVLGVARGLSNFGDASPYVLDHFIRSIGHASRVDFTSARKKGTMGL